MKLHSLIPAVVLGMAVLVQAQTSPAPQATKPAGGFAGGGGSGAASEQKQKGQTAEGSIDVLDEPNSGSRIETLILKAGPLTEVVAQVERQVKDKPTQPNEFLPNLVYAKDTRDAVVPGDLTLRRVTPVQALALVAAAAGCTFQPIMAPDETAGQKVMIIGYRIVLQAASGSGNSSATPVHGSSGMPSGARSGASGLSGGVSPSRVRSVAVQAAAGNQLKLTGDALPGANPSSYQELTPADNNRPFVRVYAIGFIMTGTDEEKGKKVNNLEELIGQALGQAKLDLNPDINIHVKTGALMSKATAAQHEIIEQVVQAMKENATQPAAPAKP